MPISDGASEGGRGTRVAIIEIRDIVRIKTSIRVVPREGVRVREYRTREWRCPGVLVAGTQKKVVVPKRRSDDLRRKRHSDKRGTRESSERTRREASERTGEGKKREKREDKKRETG